MRGVLRSPLRGVVRGATGGGGVLDLIGTAAAAAYGMRKLRGAYGGPAIRLRRSSDNAEADIGFTGAGDLDTVAAASFIGGGSGFATTWYDQSGNSNHGTQATAANQPTYVAAAQNGRAGIDFLSTAQSLNAGTGASVLDLFNGGGELRFVGVFDTVTGSSFARKSPGWTHENEGSGPFRFRLRQTTSGAVGLWAETSNNFSIGQVVIEAVEYNSDNLTTPAVFHLNGTDFSTPVAIQTPTGTRTSDAAIPLNLGAFDGRLFEAVLFDAILSGSNRVALRDNQNSYWGVY